MDLGFRALGMGNLGFRVEGVGLTAFFLMIRAPFLAYALRILPFKGPDVGRIPSKRGQ